MFTEINKVSNIIVKLDNKIEALHPKHTKRRDRLLRRGTMLTERLRKLVSIKMNTLKSDEIDYLVDAQLDWMGVRVTNRIGRKTQQRERGKACLLQR